MVTLLPGQQDRLWSRRTDCSVGRMRMLETLGDGGADHSLRLRRLLIAVPLVLFVVIGIEQLELTPHFVMTRELMQTQDVPVLLLVSVLLLGLAFVSVPADWTEQAERIATSGKFIVATILLAGLITALGTRTVALNTAVSHDELMAKFDAEIIASGRLLAPIAPEWRPFASALQPAFRLPVPGDIAWVSAYLPGNAAIRAVLGKVFNAELTNAILVMTALLALFGIARQLWPQRPDACAIAVVLGATSSQVLGQGMTPFAMTAHLTLYLVWLWLFQRDTTSSHIGALVVGFLATGLHQIVFHPLFVAPFILQLLIERRWRLTAFYVSGYAVIGIFWIVYGQLALKNAGIAPEAAATAGGAYFLDRVLSLLSLFRFLGFETMVQNLMRFAAWQNPVMLVLLVPGMVIAWKGAWTDNRILRPLAAGVVLTVIAMFILLPFQDIGWGYRYVHGLIGSTALLATAAWVGLTEGASARERRAAWGVAAATTAVAMLVLLPMHLRFMYSHISPYARVNAAVDRIGTDAVIIEVDSIYNGIELIRNDPDLKRRPLVFALDQLTEPLVRELCTRMSVTVFDGAEAAKSGVRRIDPTTHAIYPTLLQIRQFAESDDCRTMKR
jgi:hypothetical protein